MSRVVAFRTQVLMYSTFQVVQTLHSKKQSKKAQARMIHQESVTFAQNSCKILKTTSNKQTKQLYSAKFS